MIGAPMVRRAGDFLGLGGPVFGVWGFGGVKVPELHRLNAKLRIRDAPLSARYRAEIHARSQDPAAGFVQEALAFGSETVEINLDRTEISPVFHRHVIGPASEVVPLWVNELLAG